jgi:hypothetical protein
MTSCPFDWRCQCAVVKVDLALNFEQQVGACPQSENGIKAKTTDQAETWMDVDYEQ